MRKLLVLKKFLSFKRLIKLLVIVLGGWAGSIYPRSLTVITGSYYSGSRPLRFNNSGGNAFMSCVMCNKSIQITM